MWISSGEVSVQDDGARPVDHILTGIPSDKRKEGIMEVMLIGGFNPLPLVVPHVR